MSQEQVKIPVREGVILYLRPETARPILYYRIKVAGIEGYERRSTGTTNIDDAKRIAEDRYSELIYLRKNGRRAASRKFEFVAGEWLKHAQNKKKEYQVNYGLMPFFRDFEIGEIKPLHIHEWKEWRGKQAQAQQERILTNPRRRRPEAIIKPRRSDFGIHAQIHNYKVLNQIMQFAYTREYITKNELPEVSQLFKGIKNKRRPAFTEDQIKRILEELPNWAESGRSTTRRFQRERLRHIVMFLIYSGIRPGTEYQNMKWGQVLMNRPGIAGGCLV
ncbi:MAG: hypothetical protein ACK5U4_06675 [Rhodospirillales bacterium]|jgi:hypothetical protein